jgi:hypothetical protein
MDAAMSKALIALLLLAACDTPPLVLRFRLTDSGSQQCIAPNSGNETTDCADIPLACDAVLSIRVVPPDHPELPYVFVCQPPVGGPHDLCSIASVDLPQQTVPVPEQVLEIQVAVFPRDAVGTDEKGNLVCPIVEYAANGLPVTGGCFDNGADGTCPRPAVGGRAYYYPGDEETVVDLGCTELEMLNGEKCQSTNRTEVIATVTEFEFPTTVDPVTANRLFVSIGEPTLGQSGNYSLDASQSYLLPHTASATWSDTIENPMLVGSYCIEVLEDVPMATRTLTCSDDTDAIKSRIDASGIRLKPDKLAEILTALNGNTSFPSEGLVLGIVLDDHLMPVEGATIKPSKGSVLYLSADRTSFSDTGPTSANGIFVSTDAPYKTTFDWVNHDGVRGFGGLVEGKVTIVVLQESTPTAGS